MTDNTPPKPEQQAKLVNHKKVWQVVLSIVLLLALFGLVLYLSAFAGKGNEYTTRYGNKIKMVDDNHYFFNGFTVAKNGPVWVTQIEKDGKLYNVNLRHGPLEVEPIPVTTDIQGKILTSRLIIYTVNPKASGVLPIAMFEMSKIITPAYQLLNIPGVTAFTEPSNITVASLNQSYPIITCQNATATTRVIEFKTGDDTLAFSDGDCIIVQGKTDGDVVSVADRIVYELLGIIQTS